MALYEFRLPDIGEGIAEGEVVAWHVSPGQRVSEDQDMVEVMTDKATVTIGAPKSGRIAQLNAKVGEVVRVGSVLVVIDTAEQGEARDRASADGSEPPEKRPSRPPPDNDTARSRFQAPVSRAQAKSTPAPRRDSTTDAMAASAVGDIRESLPGVSYLTRAIANGRSVADGARSSASSAASPAAEGAAVAPLTGDAVPSRLPKRPEAQQPIASQRPEGGKFFSEKPLATPATRKLARDLGIDLRHVPPTGAGGRVTKVDLESFSGESSGAEEQAREERKPFVGLRRRIAERMQLSKHKAAHFTFVEEVEVDALHALIERAKPAAAKRGIKLHYLPFIVKAVTLALAKHPILNSMLDERTNELVYRSYYHIGIATATDHGLVVPVLRDADRKSPLAIAAEIQQLAESARSGKLSAAELSGSTFTITSLGRMGGLLATPVLNYPEVGILGVHRVKERPVVRAGRIEIGSVMLLSLSLDHRIVDGHVGAAFAYDVIAYLEQPELLLLELS
jgi:pyruvate dehydrogenase E2 component (dihydrolipoamide acetyltransferase)